MINTCWSWTQITLQWETHPIQIENYKWIRQISHLTRATAIHVSFNGSTNLLNEGYSFISDNGLRMILQRKTVPTEVKMCSALTTGTPHKTQLRGNRTPGTLPQIATLSLRPPCRLPWPPEWSTWWEHLLGFLADGRIALIWLLLVLQTFWMEFWALRYYTRCHFRLIMPHWSATVFFTTVDLLRCSQEIWKTIMASVSPLQLWIGRLENLHGKGCPT